MVDFIRNGENLMNLTLDYLSLGILILVLLILVYGLVVIHDIPYEIAVKRNHPHQDAIHVAGWISRVGMPPSRSATRPETMRDATPPMSMSASISAPTAGP